MAQRKRKPTVVLAADADGRVVAAALPQPDDDVRAGMEPLEGQTIHEVELPDALAQLKSPQAVLGFIGEAQVSPTGELRLPKIQRED